jgi:hypothetical protein
MATRKNINVNGATIQRVHIFRNADTKEYAIVARYRLDTEDVRFAVSGDVSLMPDAAQSDFLTALFTQLEQTIGAKEQL